MGILEQGVCMSSFTSLSFNEGSKGVFKYPGMLLDIYRLTQLLLRKET